MSAYIFENMSQGQASTITATDLLGFFNTSVTARTVSATPSPAGDTIRTITLSSLGRSLIFDQTSLSQLSQADNIVFNDGSALRLGTNSAEAASYFTLSATRLNVVYGFAGNDMIATAGGNDYIYAGEGNDTVSGGAGNEHIYGFGLIGDPTRDGADSLSGADGNDYIQGNAGADTIDGGNGNDRLVGGGGDDSILGGAGQDTVNGNLGNDSIDGGAGEDSLRGGQGNDMIAGGDSNDIVLGDLGNDTLNGGTGVDVMTGGDGADIFQFGTGDAAGFSTSGAFAYFTDTIRDFVDGADELRLNSATGAVGDADVEIVRGDDIGASFSVVSAARDYAQGLLNGNPAANDVAIVKVGSDIYLFYDSTGIQGATIDSIIKIQGATDTSLFTAADFA